MQPHTRFKIVEFQNPSKEIVYRVTGIKPDGGRVRSNFRTLGEATGEKQRLENEALNIPSTPLRSTRLSELQIAEAEMAFAELNGKPLLPAVRFYLGHYTEPVTKINVQEAFEKFLQTKQSENNRPATLRNLRSRVGQLVSRHAEQFVSDIQPEELRAIIFQPGRSHVSADNDRRALLSFFTWATKQGFCRENPISKIDPIKTDREEPEILSLEACRRLLDAATANKQGVLLPYVALALFCAIRPTELSRITWKDIDLKAQTVTLGAKIAKMRQRRIVEISDNCLEWLLPHAPKRTPIKGVNWRRDFDKVQELAGLKAWTQDILRHTGISYHLSEHQHEGKTAQWAGNSPDIIQRHYKGLVKKSEAEEFWNIRPGDAEKKILRLSLADQ